MNTISYSMRMTIAPDRKTMGVLAGKCGEAILCSLLEKKNTLRIIMGSAPSQDEVLAYLRGSNKIDWSRIEVFHMDEYIGISPDNPASFSNYLARTLLDHVPVKAFHRIISEGKDPQAVCAEYGALIEKAPIDMVFLGIGENGHIAFNDPAMADLKDPLTMKIVQLDDICRMQQVHDGCFPNFDAVPKQAFTLTVPVLMSGAHLVCTVPSARKNAACLSLVMGPVSAACPCTAMRIHPDANVFMDNESGKGIPEFETAEKVLGEHK